MTPKRYIKKYNKIAVSLKDICQPVSASEEFKESLLKQIESTCRQSGKLAVGDISGSEQNISVIVHMEPDILRGNIILSENERLSDFLNSTRQFIELTDVTVTGPDGEQEHLEEIHINKSAIKMIGTLENNAARGTGCVVHKLPVHTAMHMPDFEIDGLLYCRTGENIAQLLEMDSTFLPCTEVNVLDLKTKNHWKAGFAAVNRRQVSILHIAE